jgi:hypothetical protein
MVDIGDTARIVHAAKASGLRKFQGILMDVICNEGIVLVGKNRNGELVHKRRGIALLHLGEREHCAIYECSKDRA